MNDFFKLNWNAKEIYINCYFPFSFNFLMLFYLLAFPFRYITELKTIQKIHPMIVNKIRKISDKWKEYSENKDKN